MRCVLDSCVALKWVLPELDSATAIRLRDEFAGGIHELLTPDIFPIEVAHNLAKAERRGIIAPGEGTTKLADVVTPNTINIQFNRNKFMRGLKTF